MKMTSGNKSTDQPNPGFEIQTGFFYARSGVFVVIPLGFSFGSELTVTRQESASTSVSR